MENIILSKPTDPTFKRDGLEGFRFPTESKNVEVYYVDCERGHGGIVSSDSITHVYYVIDGSGEFIIDGNNLHVSAGQVVEILPNHTFDYNGQMKMVMIMEPPFSPDKILQHEPELKG
jgi:mannose-6-phosphate isomerase-like protein (cupin superfamily)